MALKGTIRDFGIADIFQLIGQQAKTGVLILRNDVDEVRVYFKDGAVVRADSATRPGQMLLGSFLVRAEVLSQEQLDHALGEQRRTLKRLGTVLVELGYVKLEPIIEFSTLQMTETIYSLFSWKNGTYEFEGEPVEASPDGIEPIRAENIVMNGIRMVDEWPAIREKLPSYTWTVEQMKPLPPKKRRAQSSADEFDLSSLTEEGSQSMDLDDIGAYERMIYSLVEPGRDVQKIIDLARLGEFEACRALGNLMSGGYVRVLRPTAPLHTGETGDVITETPGQRVARIAGIAGRIAVSAVLVLIGAMLLGRISPAQLGLDPGGELSYEPKPIEQHFADTQIRVIKRTLEVYRYETGVYPKSLETLVDYGLLNDRDIRFPYHRPYFYRLKDDGSIVLLPPIN
jgi:uncharacterized protein DUF4388